MAPPKLPRCCKTCGDTNPDNFVGYRASLCKSCRTAQNHAYFLNQREKDNARCLRYSRRKRRELFSSKVLTYIEMRLRWGFEPPSLQEIALAVRVSVPTVRQHLQALEADGKIIRHPGKHRGLQLVE